MKTYAISYRQATGSYELHGLGCSHHTRIDKTTWQPLVEQTGTQEGATPREAAAAFHAGSPDCWIEKILPCTKK